MDKATILATVNSRTHRSETSIDAFLLKALREIARRTLILKTSTTGSTVSGQKYIAKPSDMVGDVAFNLVIDDSQVFPISWDAFLRDEDGYCVYGDNIYIYPTPTGKTYTLYYPKEHPTDLSTILIPDDYEMAVEHYVASKIYEKYELSDKMGEQLTLFENEIAKLSTHKRMPPVCFPHKGV